MKKKKVNFSGNATLVEFRSRELLHVTDVLIHVIVLSFCFCCCCSPGFIVSPLLTFV